MTLDKSTTLYVDLLDQEEKARVGMYILENMNNDIILGHEELKSSKIFMDLRTQMIMLNGKKLLYRVPLNAVPKSSTEPSTTIYVEELIKKYSGKIDSKQPMRNESMRITLVSEEIPKNKIYLITGKKEQFLKSN